MQVVALVGDHQQKLRAKVEEVEDGLLHGSQIEQLIHNSQKGDDEAIHEPTSHPISINIKPDASINYKLEDQMERTDQDERADNNLLPLNTSDAVKVSSSRARSSHNTAGPGLRGPNGAII